ncbi:hypothetical protein [Bradyrhizobium sp. SZCCHNR1093]|uniref:hypothetical protein n=1 Tax=Bradyrhizobium sp. SZCCHNR1093 TaxID=3057368 RepID=UPI0028EC487E|nr:hypothetical protein [Bradyrhizobium sp. SZCCHNR1093]
MTGWGEFSLWLPQVATWVLQTTLAALLAAASFITLLPTKFGERYLGFHFDRKLAELKDGHAQEIEKLREQLAHLGDRGKRSNEMEFAAIKLVWEGFVEAYLATTTCALGHVEPPDFARMSEAETEAFISESDFPDREKDRLRRAIDKHTEYVAIVNWRQITRAGREQHQARLLLRKQRIFMPKELSDQFMEAINKLGAVFVQRKMGSQRLGSTDGFGGPIPEFLNSHDEMFERLAMLSNSRLFRDEILPNLQFQRGKGRK